MEYTKGEWKIFNYRMKAGHYIRSFAGENIAVITIAVVTENGEEGKDNAHLISAAPDMYEALREIWGASLGADTLRVLQPWFKKVEQALAKAEGRV